VTNLPFEIATEEEVKEELLKGIDGINVKTDIEKIQMLLDLDTKKPLGWAFVLFKTAEQAETVILKLDGKVVRKGL
jgi:RNA recognition motif-containing protein